MPLVNSHNSWSKLEEVWLGDVYPASWYNHLDPAVRDAFRHLTEITKEDLNVIQQTIESFGVTVRRPEYHKLEDYVSVDGELTKPQICPRDQFVVIGNTLVGHEWALRPWQSALDTYSACADSTIIPTTNGFINGANIVRLGTDLIVDTEHPDIADEDFFQDYRVTVVNNGGHLDGCFATLRPKLILCSNYFDHYDTTFPGWGKINLSNPEFSDHTKKITDWNNRWWLPGTECNQSFNEHILKYATDWVGNYTETYFELNCLMIDEHNIIMLGYNSKLEKHLKEYGITVHWVPFRTRTFWDGGMHCLTVDIRRQSIKETVL